MAMTNIDRFDGRDPIICHAEPHIGGVTKTMVYRKILNFYAKSIHFKNIFLLVLPHGKEQKTWNYKI